MKCSKSDFVKRINAGGLLGILSLSLLLVGCATPTQPRAMVPGNMEVLHRSQESISIAVSGGKRTTAVSTPQISDEAFAEALRVSFLTSKLFMASSSETKVPLYSLDAFIAQVTQPMMGLSMRVDMEVGYSLADTRTKKVLWQRSIQSTYTAAMSEAFVGVTRLRLATEGAARENIRKVLADISALNLP